MGSAPSRVGRAPSSGRDDGETAVLRGQSEVARGWPGHCAPHGALEDGPSPSGVPRATVTSGISNLEKKMNCGIQSLSSGPLAQKQNGLWGTQLLLPGFTPNFSIQVRLSLSQVQCILLETRARKQQLSEVCSHNYQYDGNPRGQGQLPEHVSAHLLSTSIPVANASQRGEPHTSKVGGRAEN
ncbi:brain and acute leukemia cytoplasmic protein isoform X2 [Heterocephalus glaber]|uniref:Brain and acute leukemia cytoplasmic protein isoform X2 n=1 Tax=Heterocephalus glaber TaxID=10181 RepID=A0AAX6T7U6_HETGA|nr:brain and acute leukemia cytoplasmic protein isoform X2 [Heterocephalus glaber]